MRKLLLLGLMLLLASGAASAAWTAVIGSDRFIQYVDRATIQRNGNLVKMWDLKDNKTVQTVDGVSFLSIKSHQEYDCKEKKRRILAFASLDGQMGNGKVVYNTSEKNMKLKPIQPSSVGESLWKIACGKK